MNRLLPLTISLALFTLLGIGCKRTPDTPVTPDFTTELVGEYPITSLSDYTGGAVLTSTVTGPSGLTITRESNTTVAMRLTYAANVTAPANNLSPGLNTNVSGTRTYSGIVFDDDGSGKGQFTGDIFLYNRSQKSMRVYLADVVLPVSGPRGDLTFKLYGNGTKR